jgi:phosphoglycolate phosphatase-like HAD superfamily hydrolase
VLRGVIFDIDGTLVDSNEAHARSWVDALHEAGYDVPFEILWPMIGMGGDKLLPTAIGVESNSAIGKKLSKQRWALFERDYLPRLRPTRGARDLVQRMKDDRLSMVVASSASGNELGALMEAADVADLMEETTSSSDAEESKPDPDIVQAAVRKSGLEPGELIMLGDTPYDVQAAIGASVKLVGLLCGGWTMLELSGATALYDDPEDLLHWYDYSPFAVKALAGKGSRR